MGRGGRSRGPPAAVLDGVHADPVTDLQWSWTVPYTTSTILGTQAAWTAFANEARPPRSPHN